jgi:hypothetical protein
MHTVHTKVLVLSLRALRTLRLCPVCLDAGSAAHDWCHVHRALLRDGLDEHGEGAIAPAEAGVEIC